MVRAKGARTRGWYLHGGCNGRRHDRPADDCVAWRQVWMARGILCHRYSRASVAFAVAAGVSPGTVCGARRCGARAGSTVVALCADQSFSLAVDVRKDAERPGLVFLSVLVPEILDGRTWAYARRGRQDRLDRLPRRRLGKHHWRLVFGAANPARHETNPGAHRRYDGCSAHRTCW